MKKIITLFLLISCITFAIPDFEKLGWGFSINAIKGFYPKVSKEFATSEGVTKYNFYPKNSDTGKITFYLFQDQLYKIVTEFDKTKVSSDDVRKIYNEYEGRYGTPTASPIDETYTDFTIKGNERTWTTKSTYISFIGQDYIDKDNRVTDSKLIMEYGLIDPAKRKDNSSLNDLILDNN
jgi:NDP-sugar pyrophosphorylase family protein